MFHILIAFFLLLITYLSGFQVVEAQDMNSSNYKLQGGNFNTSSAAQSSSGFRLVDLVGQTSAEVFSAKGYIIQSGFLNRAANSSLFFSISPTILNFGSLTPNKPVTDNLIITVGSGNFPGYTIYVAQNKQLSTEAGAQIPNTLCDAFKNKICNIDKGNEWSENTSYGFGYNIQGQTVPININKSYIFRPFASLAVKENPVIIMQSHESKTSHSAGMIVKLNVSKDQPVGIYENSLIFNVLPGI